MKTIEEIKKEYKSSTGSALPIYTYKGKLGVLYDEHYDDMPEFIPMAEFLAKDIVYDKVCDLTDDVDADLSEEGAEITDEPIRAPWDEKKLLWDGVWSTVAYSKSDEYSRELLTTTDRYYNWESERKLEIARLCNILESSSLDINHSEGASHAEWRKKLIEDLTKENEGWVKICSRFENADGWDLEYPHFMAVLKEAFKPRLYSKPVCDVVNEFMIERQQAEKEVKEEMIDYKALSEYERQLMVDTDSNGRDTSKENYGYTSYRTSCLRCIEDELVNYADGKIDAGEFDTRMVPLEGDWDRTVASYEKPGSCILEVPIDFRSLVKQAADGIEWEGSASSQEQLETISNYL